MFFDSVQRGPGHHDRDDVSCATSPTVTDRPASDSSGATAAVVRAHRDLIALLTHDIRNPVTILHSYVEILSAQLAGRVEPGELDMLEQCVACSQRLFHLAENFSLANRLESDPLRLRRERCPLDLVVRAAVAPYEHIAHVQGRSVDLRIEARPCNVFGDREELGRVIENLLSNALKHAPEHSPVTVTLSRKDSSAVLAVHNGGPGIPPDQQTSLFQRYARGVSSAGRSSIGLGLYIVRTITEAHGGSVSVSSLPGAGTEFRVTLPLHRLPEQTA